MLYLPTDGMLLANKQRWWYILYSDDKQDFCVEKLIAGGLFGVKLGLVYEQRSHI